MLGHPAVVPIAGSSSRQAHSSHLRDQFQVISFEATTRELMKSAI